MIMSTTCEDVMSERKLLESFFQLMHTAKAELTEELSNHGLSVAPMHIKLIKVLSKKAPCTAQYLAETLGRDKAQITRLVQDLVAANLVVRSPNPDDKRSQLLHLEQGAMDILEKMSVIEKRMMARMCNGVSDEEQALFISLANKFKCNLRDKK